ncbi:Protein unc-13 B [Geranomyces michiganensis]|nr:Protein unc-13 B [Geranomyces michiganensis]
MLMDSATPSWSSQLVDTLLYPLNPAATSAVSSHSLLSPRASPSITNLKAETASVHSHNSKRSRKAFSKLLGGGSGEHETGEAKLEPPASQRPPPASAITLAKHFARVLGIPAESVDRQAAKAAEACAGSELMGADLAAYLSLVRLNAGANAPSDFDDGAHYATWKATEVDALERVVTALTGSAEYAAEDSHPVQLTIAGAEGLLAKDATGTSNPYCVITFDGVSFVSQPMHRTRSPNWNMKVTLPLRPSSPDVAISIWNRSSDPRSQRRDDSFLGCLLLPARSLLASAATAPARYPLAKRSSRSHVAGTIEVFSVPVVVKPDVQCLRSNILRFAPPDPRAAYAELLARTLEVDVGNQEGLLSEISIVGLNAVAAAWRIGEHTRTVLMFEALTDLHSQGALPASVLQSEGSAQIDKIAEHAHLSNPDLLTLRETCKTLSALLLHNLRTFFNYPLTAKKANDLDAMTGILASMQTNRLLHKPEGDVGNIVKGLLKEALSARYLGLHAIANSPSSSSPDSPSECLITLLKSIETELASYDRHLDTLYFGHVHVPDMAAAVFFERLMPDLEGYTRSPAHARNFGDAFDLYDAVAALRAVYERVDYRLAERFKLTEWFAAPLREWVAVSERKFVEWMEAAVKVDDYVRSSPTVPYSSSVLDMFTSFQQQINFARKLRWPDSDQEAQVMERLLQGISDTLGRYVDAMVAKVGEDLTRCRTGLANAGPTTAALAGPQTAKKKSRIHLKFGKSKRGGREIDPSEIRIPVETCVKLENIDAVPTLFADLCAKTLAFPGASNGDADGESPPPTPPKSVRASAATQTPVLILARQSVTVTLQSISNLAMTRPSTTQISARVRIGGKDLGTTNPVPQTRTLLWPDASAVTYYSLLPHAAAQPISETAHTPASHPELEVCVMHHVPGEMNKPYLFGRGVATGKWMDSTTVDIDLGGSNRRARLSVSQISGAPFLRARVAWLSARGIERAVALVADQLTHDLRFRLKALARKTEPKTPIWSKPSAVFSKLHKSHRELISPPPASSSSASAAATPVPQDEEHEAALAALLSYLDVNLEILSEQCGEDLSLRTVAGTWDLVPRIVESLVTDPAPTTSPSSTPIIGSSSTSSSSSSSSSSTSSSATSPARIAFLKAALRALRSWFSADGDGLDDATLDTRSYRDAVAVLNHAHLSRKALEKALCDGTLVSDAKTTSAQGDDDDGEWACRLVAAKGGRDAVDVFVARRFR